MAMWDVVAKIAQVPLWRLVSQRFNGGQFDEKVLVYPGGGYYYPGKELEGLRGEMRGYQSQGYKVVKMKVGGADLATDLKRIEAVIEVAGAGANVAVDANGRFDLATALAFGKAIEPYGGFADAIPVVEGYVCLPQEPGVGVELKRAMFAEMRKRLELA